MDWRKCTTISPEYFKKSPAQAIRTFQTVAEEFWPGLINFLSKKDIRVLLSNGFVSCYFLHVMSEYSMMQCALTKRAGDAILTAQKKSDLRPFPPLLPLTVLSQWKASLSGFLIETRSACIGIPGSYL